MARPLRCFEEGRCYEVSDRTLGEAYHLLPSTVVNAIIVGAMALACAAVPEVRPLGFTVLSDHWHLMLRAGHDPAAVSKFMQILKSTVARAMNAHLGRRGIFWARRFSSIVVLDDRAVLRRLVYFVMNAVNAGLCARFEEWPGVSTTAHLVGVRSACGDVELPLALPPGWEGLDGAQLAEQRGHLLAEVRAAEAEVAAERMRLGLRRPRVEQILGRTHHSDRPANPKRTRKPLCFSSSAPLAEAFRKTWRAWVAAYRAASDAFRAGVLDVMFPAQALPPRLTRPPIEAAA